MRQRCTNENCHDYKWYGGRGIGICEEWDDFSKFRAWALSNGYEEGLTLDHIDDDGEYAPNNCRWITIQAQQQNKHGMLSIEIGGETLTVSEACEKYSLPKSVFYDRRHRNWDVDRIFSTPVLRARGGYRPKGVSVYHG